jgi:formate hydrogenlyase subunit 3/multisubunit Na+/H+ antiporter MnhD subunit
MLLPLILALPLLAALALAAHFRPRAGYAGASVLCGLAALGLVAWLAMAPAPDLVVLPLGVPWVGMQLALDPLSGWFALIWAVCGLLTCLGALGLAPHAKEEPARVEKFLLLFLAAMLLTLLAADSFTLLFGFEAMSLCSWALVVADHTNPAKREAGRLYLVMAAFAGACLLPAFGLLAGADGALAFSAIRAAPPEGTRALLVLVLALLGAGSKAGLFPLHLWLPVAHPAAPAPASALMSGVMTKVALYVLARLLFDLLGPAQPWWWGAPLVALGVASAVMGVLRALLEAELKTILACSTIENVGVIAAGFGLALVFRGTDLGPLAALALGAALLHALAHGIAKTMMFLVAGQVLAAAGTTRLDRLGGLLRRMKLAGGAALVGALTLAALPPLALFAPEWLLLQALLAAPRIGTMALSIGMAAAAALLGLAAATL